MLELWPQLQGPPSSRGWSETEQKREGARFSQWCACCAYDMHNKHAACCYVHCCAFLSQLAGQCHSLVLTTDRCRISNVFFHIVDTSLIDYSSNFSVALGISSDAPTLSVVRCPCPAPRDGEFLNSRAGVLKLPSTTPCTP